MGIRNYINRNTFLETLSKILYFFDWSSHQTFASSYRKYRGLYLEYKKENAIDPKWVVPMWQEFMNSMEKDFLGAFDYSFLKNPIIKQNIFVSINSRLQKAQMTYLTKIFGEQELYVILPESSVGNPTITNFRYRTSHNTIHHLHHLAKFSDEAKINLNSLESAVEWGGGYGNFARIFLRMNPEATYTIIDLPIFSFIQATYLSTIFGPDKINLIIETGQNIQKGKINIIPINKSILGGISWGEPEIFVSTWALSESSDYAQNFVGSLAFFGARYLLFGHQESSSHVPYAESITKHLSTYNIIYHKKIPLLKNNYYLFCEKK